MTAPARQIALDYFDRFLEQSEVDLDLDPLHFAKGIPTPEARSLFETLVGEYEKMSSELHLQKPKTQVGGYLLGAELGRGGMGRVFDATKDGCRIALKLLPSPLSLQPKALARMEREVNTLKRLDHPNIVRLIDHGVDYGQTFLAMEIVAGGTLTQRITVHDFAPANHSLAAHIRQPLRQSKWARQCVKWTIQLLRALSTAHAVGIIHRDIKPCNVLIGEDEQAKLADFGLAYWAQAPTLTSTGKVMGTPGYLAPERLLDPTAAHSPRVDLYSVATLLFECLTGSLPFPGDLPQVLAAANQGPPNLRLFLAPPAEPAMQAILERGLESRPQNRYSSATEFANDLERWLGGNSVQARRGLWRRRLARKIRRSPRRWMAGAATVVLLSLVGSQSLYRQVEQHSLALSRLQRAHQLLKASDERLANFHALLSPENGESTNNWNEQALLRHGSDPRSLAQAKFLSEAPDYYREIEHLLLPEMGGPEVAAVSAALRELNRQRATGFAWAGNWEKSEKAWMEFQSLGGAMPSAGAEISTTLDLDAYSLEKYKTDGESPVWALLPLAAVPLTNPRRITLSGLLPGSYLLKVRRKGQKNWIHIPLLLERGKTLTFEDLELPSDRQIGKGWKYIPPGAFIAGGDPIAQTSEARTLRNIPYGYFMSQHEVTVGEYKVFLWDHYSCALLAWLSSGFIGECPPLYTHSPRANGSTRPQLLLLDFFREPKGNYWKNSCAIHLLSPQNALAYARWLSENDPTWDYFLPSGDEWEKGARGVDGRFFPWGNELNWNLSMAGTTKILHPIPDNALMRPGQYPADSSPYEIADMAGNIREICRDHFQIDPKRKFHLARGGEQSMMAHETFRSAVRWEAQANLSNFDFGIRLVRRLKRPKL